ncbi:hypothetical protein ACI65C_004067 [Semiaphis heraclei]
MKCTGELYTNHQKEDPLPKSDHNQFKDKDKANVEKTLCVMKEQTKAGLSKPLEVYVEKISKLDGDTRKMPVEDGVKRTLRNQRSKLNPVEPNSLENLCSLGKKLCSGMLNLPSPAILPNTIEPGVLLSATHRRDLFHVSMAAKPTARPAVVSLDI